MTASPLRLALRAHLGQTLTPEVAAAIESATLTADAGGPLDLAAFGSELFGEYTIRAERLEDIIDEIHALHVEHWAETERHRHGIALNLDYGFMLGKERAGKLIQFTMRSADGELVGNLRMYLALSRHTQTEFASEDTLFIKPAHRGGWAVAHLMRFAERGVLSLGIREIRTSSKIGNRADVLMKRAGYRPVSIEFVKIY